MGSWTANLVLYGIAFLAYFHPLRIGATFLLTAAILLAVWFVLFLAGMVFYVWVHRKWTALTATQNTPGA